jgi:hypothetical protein
LLAVLAGQLKVLALEVSVSAVDCALAVVTSAGNTIAKTHIIRKFNLIEPPLL